MITTELAIPKSVWIDDLERIENAVFAPYGLYDPDIFKSWCNLESIAIAAFDSDSSQSMIGYALAEPLTFHTNLPFVKKDLRKNPVSYYFDSIAVLPEYLFSGVGKSLFFRMIEEIYNMGISRLTMHCIYGNLPGNIFSSRKAMIALGAKKIGTAESYLGLEGIFADYTSLDIPAAHLNISKYKGNSII